MSESFESDSWYRVEALTPGIRSHAHFHRHCYRGEYWYVLQDRANQRAHRLSPDAYFLVGLMDGQRTIGEIWRIACERLGDDAPSQDETIRILGALHVADVLRCDVSADLDDLLRRNQRRKPDEGLQRFSNPFSIRVPLYDPDELLERALPWFRPLFSSLAAILSLALVATAAVLAVLHRAELGREVAATLLDPRNLLLILLVYPCVKALHELGHAIAAKHWGCEVHETGLLFLVGVPLPYVDASEVATLSDKRLRAGVGAAGIVVELVLASLALLVWLAVEPGWVRLAAYDVLWIGGVSTLLFNGNPLLRFDGYYVMADLIEIPSLADRSRHYWISWLQRNVCGLDSVRDPVNVPSERPWLVGYGALAACYRVFVTLSIALFVAERFFGLGVALAIASVTMQLAWPLAKGMAFVVTSPRFVHGRGRALAGTGALILCLGLVMLPLPSRTRADGVVWPPEGAEVRAAGDGFVVELLARPGDRVKAGQPLVATREPTLEWRVSVQEARLRELRARLHAERTSDRVRAHLTADEVRTTRAALARARERLGDVVVRSPVDGTFVVPAAVNLAGRFVEQGSLLGYVLDERIDRVRVALPQDEITRVREGSDAVWVRLSREPARVLPAQIRREVPGASHELPTAALGTAGGGRIPVDSSDPDGVATLEPFFQLELLLPESVHITEIGGRVHVRLDHGTESLAAQVGRALHGLLLRRIGL